MGIVCECLAYTKMGFLGVCMCFSEDTKGKGENRTFGEIYTL